METATSVYIFFHYSICFHNGRLFCTTTLRPPLWSVTFSPCMLINMVNWGWSLNSPWKVQNKQERSGLNWACVWLRTERAVFVPSLRLVGAQCTLGTLTGVESFPCAIPGNPFLPIHLLQSLACFMCVYNSQLKEQLTGTLKTQTSGFQSDQMSSELW